MQLALRERQAKLDAILEREGQVLGALQSLIGAGIESRLAAAQASGLSTEQQIETLMKFIDMLWTKNAIIWFRNYAPS